MQFVCKYSIVGMIFMDLFVENGAFHSFTATTMVSTV